VRSSAYGLALVLSILTPAIAAAQDQGASAADVSLARTLGLEGVQLADAGNCAAAIDKLQRAETLYHAPTILVRLGECQVQIGKIVAGTETLQRVVREALPPKAPKAFTDAQARAKKVLDAALPKVARLKIHVDMPAGVRPVIKLDGESISLAALDVDRPADPGSHVVEASAPGFLVARTETTLHSGASGAANLKLEPDPAAQAVPPASAYGQEAVAPGSSGPPPMGPPPQGQPYPPPGPQGGPPPGAESQGGGSKTLGFVLIGLGGAGVAVGSVFGALALGTRSELDTRCPPDKSQCPAETQGDIDSLKTSATVSTVGFAVGGAAVVGGLIVLLTSKSSTAAASQKPPLRASIEPFVGPGSLGLSGAF
jgi:hypothetical protein